jgi:phenol 2-monooxygenase
MSADIRNRCIVEGGKHGTLMTIPREDHLVRLYVQLDYPVFAFDPSGTTAEKIIAQAKHIFRPYKFQTPRIDWVSTYRPGRRVAGCATCACNRVFLCGDALHCQSPKSGMGMNSSMQDAYNLGWKLANVVKGRSPTRLLSTYSSERLPVAHQLQAFDEHFSRKFIEGFATKGLTLDESVDEEHHDISGTTCNYAHLAPMSWVGFQGVPKDIKEERSDSPMASSPPSRQRLQLGSRIPDVQIVNHCGGDSTWLHRTLRSTGQWHLVVFAGNIATSAPANQKLHSMSQDHAFESLASKCGILRIVTVHASLRRDIEITDLPLVLRSTPGGPTLDDDRVFTDVESYHHGHGRAYQCLFGDEEGEEQQRLVLLRPDSHVAFVGGFDDIAAVSDLLAEWTIL